MADFDLISDFKPTGDQPQAIQALNRGFDVYLVEDAVGARTAEARTVGLKRAGVAGVVPTHTEMAIYELLTVAGTAAFRDVLSIIKEEADPEP